MSESADPQPPLQRTDNLPVTTSQIQDAQGICRICRGEGTPAEPLFYPCKCSGSIKYVHQDCLMEWLSHSQKKYCELCKTSYRFTKLYAPDMPKSLPFQVLLHHMSRYLFQNALVWLRGALALCVWIFWLPYFMRSIWSFMFWVSDKGFISRLVLNAKGWEGSHSQLQCPAPGAGTCPASPLLVAQTASGAIANAMVDTLSNQSLATFVKKVFMACLGITYRPVRVEAPSQIPGTPLPSSLLSEVEFIKNITGTGTSLHHTVVAILEGQLITILVILTFILVILVRDYVIQQQPEINMRAEFPAVEDEVQPGPRLEPNAPIEPATNDEHQPDESESDDETLEEGEPIEAPGERNARLAVDVEASRGDANNFESATLQQVNQTQGSSSQEIALQVVDESLSVPAIPGRAAGEGAEAQPELESEPETGTSVPEFLRIFREAEGKPERILEIIQEQDLQEKLAYWVETTKRSLNARHAQSTTTPLISDSNDETPSRTRQPVPVDTGDDGKSSSTEILTPISGEDIAEPWSEEPASSSKGKEKETASSQAYDSLETGHISESTSEPARPRAKSDGYQMELPLNPLANNSWSFGNLPDRSEPQKLSFDAELAEGGAPNPEHDQQQPQNLGPRGVIETQEEAQEETQEEAQEEAQEETQEEAATPGPAPPVTEAADGTVRQEPIPGPVPEGFMGRITNFMWGDIAEPPPQDHGVFEGEEDVLRRAVLRGELEDEGWVDIPMGQGGNDVGDNNLQEDGMDGAAGNPDPEAIDDLDDFDGIMELIGMRGPLAGLFQNSIFCAVLVSTTILSCTFLPYNIGRISLWMLANPLRLVRIAFEASKFIQDLAMCVGTLLSWCALNILDMLVRPFSKVLFDHVVATRKGSWVLWIRSAKRVIGYMYLDFPAPAAEIRNFSALSHESLHIIRSKIYTTLIASPIDLARLYASDPSQVLRHIEYGIPAVATALKAAVAVLLNPSAWVVDFGEPERMDTVDPSLANWSAADRFWAIMAGYMTIFVISALYLKRGSPFTRGNMVEVWEAGFIETLHQASGIMKVILIISIEMLVFPLYCGLLLDVALLPLFEGATLTSRLQFTYNFPLTSVFVHWFVGTGYMFHFALFVSMCRKIMRPGVLYFIRDPDDPEFHPVRDVLERNLVTQLRKILFSAFVYGALVIVCLGGVVWGLAFSVPNVLPVHYSSNEPVLEFPVDLLFYNFLMPLAVHLLKPSDGLHIIYTWWFRRCARGLRLTYFLFGERRIDEEGILNLPANSKHAADPAYRRAFLEINKDNEVVPKTLDGAFDDEDDKSTHSLRSKRMRPLRRRKSHLVKTGQLVKNGQFVRAPASDRVKIPKSKRVFLPVTERDRRRDGKPDEGLYASDQYKAVYIPPNFRARVFTFITLIWIFAAVTGVGFTIVPLVLGRRIFQVLIPGHVRTNDIYAFSIGFYLLGSTIYAAFHMRQLLTKCKDYVERARTQITGGQFFGHATSLAATGFKLLYSYFFLLILFPLIASTLVELYLLLPLNTYLHPPTKSGSGLAGAEGRHTVSIVQAWTLGLLYVKLTASTISSLYPTSRIATAVRSVMQNGWLQPDAWLFTRAFVIPVMAISSLAILGPYCVTKILIQNELCCAGLLLQNTVAANAQIAMAYRKAYPIALVGAIAFRYVIALVGVFHIWTARIRDEAYLIGERLHNFGAGPMARRGVSTQAFRAGGPRL